MQLCCSVMFFLLHSNVGSMLGASDMPMVNGAISSQVGESKATFQIVCSYLSVCL